jgi:hypothetical protein
VAPRPVNIKKLLVFRDKVVRNAAPAVAHAWADCVRSGVEAKRARVAAALKQQADAKAAMQCGMRAATAQVQQAVAAQQTALSGMAAGFDFAPSRSGSPVATAVAAGAGAGPDPFHALGSHGRRRGSRRVSLEGAGRVGGGTASAAWM